MLAHDKILESPVELYATLEVEMEAEVVTAESKT